MEIITTRRAGGVNVGVRVGEGVSVSVGVGVCVGDCVGVAVCVAVNVGGCEGVGTINDNPGAAGIWQASRTSNEKTKRNVLR